MEKTTCDEVNCPQFTKCGEKDIYLACSAYQGGPILPQTGGMYDLIRHHPRGASGG